MGEQPLSLRQLITCRTPTRPHPSENAGHRPKPTKTQRVIRRPEMLTRIRTSGRPAAPGAAWNYAGK
nr:MAG TPA: hypothetical protein [Caudoviricetes sp.]